MSTWKEEGIPSAFLTVALKPVTAVVPLCLLSAAVIIFPWLNVAKYKESS